MNTANVFDILQKILNPEAAGRTGEDSASGEESAVPVPALSAVMGLLGLALARKSTSARSPVGLGAAFAVGLGAGMLLAPESGATLRRKVLANLFRKGEDKQPHEDQADKKAKGAAQDLGKKAGQVADTAKRVVDDIVATQGVPAE